MTASHKHLTTYGDRLVAYFRLFLVLTTSVLILAGCNTHQTREAAAPTLTAKKLTRINKHWNHFVKYTEDGPNDHWQSPEETRSLGTGDCEDLVIVKMFDPNITNAYSPDEIRLAYVHITDGTAHMVLLVGSERNPLVLDNMIDEVKRLSDTHYKPVYELDGWGRVFQNGAWLKDHPRFKKLDVILAQQKSTPSFLKNGLLVAKHSPRSSWISAR